VGVVAGFLLWSGRLPSGPQATTALEHMTGHALGPAGRELVAYAAQLPPVGTGRAADVQATGPSGRLPSE